MTYRVRFLGNLIKLAVAAIIAVVLFVIIVNAIKNPVPGATRSYTADFTDVSGLHVNADVRNKGVLVGKVESITLVRHGENTIADVGFTLKRHYRLTENSSLAVKYQNLTGIRYLDYGEQAQPGRPVDHLSADKTTPSFDITQLFNGLQPVLSTMNTNDINRFTENAVAVLQGDGSGLAPMLDSVQQLSNYARDREQVISTLVANLSRVADTMGGKSPDLVDFLHSVAIPIAAAMTVLDKFPGTAFWGPRFSEPIDRMLTELGLTPELNVDTWLAHGFPSLAGAAAALRLLPNAFAGLQLPAMTRTPGAMACSHGVAQLPTDVKVLLNCSEVTVCNAQ